MNTKLFKRVSLLCAAACFGTGLGTEPAFADGWPANIEGEWNVVANQTSGIMTISQSGDPGQCSPIKGQIIGAPLLGFYCPASGRITFHRFSDFSGKKEAYQFYAGNLAWEQAGQPMHMAGSFATRSDLENPGEYSFYGTKK